MKYPLIKFNVINVNKIKLLLRKKIMYIIGLNTKKINYLKLQKMKIKKIGKKKQII